MSNIHLPNPITTAAATTTTGTTALYTTGLSAGTQYISPGVATTAGGYYTIAPNPSYSGATWNSDLNCTGKVTATDVEIDGISVKTLLKTIEDRLAILVPDPEKLAKFEALRQCYEQYKLLEKLCQIEKTDDTK